VTAAPGDEIAAGSGDRGRLRASHADRERVVGTLKAAFVQGMLTKDEFDQRVGQTLASRTYADLAALTADLPSALVTAKSPRPARAQRGQPVLRPGRVLAVATGLYAGAWGYELLLSPGWGDNSWAPALLFQGLVVYLGILLVCVGAILASRQDKRSSGQPPRRPGARGPESRRLPRADPPRHPPTAEVAQRRRPRPSFFLSGTSSARSRPCAAA
jgi:hypothetical protein